jgi:hypothetical protein
MRFLFTGFFLLTITVSLFCQESNKGYRIRNYEYYYDSTGKSVEKTDLKYRRISNEHSWGFIDSAGNILIPLGKYSHLNPIDEQGMILAKKGGKEGFIDVNDNILIPFIYEDLGVFSYEGGVDLTPAVKNNKQGFINRKGETVIPFEYSYSSRVGYFYEPGIAVLKKNGKYGVINVENKIIIPFIYDEIDFGWKSSIVIAWKQGKWACFSTDGKQLSDFNNYKIIEGVGLDHLPANRKDLPFLVTTKEDEKKLAKLHNEIEYMNATKKNKSFLETQRGIKYAYLDKKNNFIVPFGVYDYADVFGLGRKAIVANKGKYGIIDEYGKLVLPLEYDFVERPSLFGSYAIYFVATKQNAVTLFDENITIIPRTGIVSYLDNDGNLYVTNNENKKGVINYQGKQTIPFLYDTLYRNGWINSRTSGYIAKKDGFYGFISQENEIIQPFKYNYIYAISRNMAYVDLNNKSGTFDKDGNIAIPFEYDAIHDTYYNNSSRDTVIYIVEKEGKMGTIDNKNNVIIPIIYDGLSGWVEYGPEAHFVKNNGKYGLISHQGEIIIPIEYDYVGLPRSGVIRVRKNGKYGVVSMKNKEIFPCIYDKIILDIPWFYFKNEEQKPKIVVLQKNIWKYYDLNGKLLQSNVPLKEINDKYDYIIKWGEPSNEYYDFDLKQKGGLRIE